MSRRVLGFVGGAGVTGRGGGGMYGVSARLRIWCISACLESKSGCDLMGVRGVASGRCVKDSKLHETRWAFVRAS